MTVDDKDELDAVRDRIRNAGYAISLIADHPENDDTETGHALEGIAATIFDLASRLGGIATRVDQR